MIWVNNEVQAEQVPVDSYDIAAVILHFQEQDLLVIAAYDPRNFKQGREEAKAIFLLKLRQIHAVV